MNIPNILFALFILVLTACDADSQTGVAQVNGKQIHQFKDAKTGLTVQSAEYPASWEVISRPYYTIDQKLPAFLTQIQGPDNLLSFNTPISIYISYQNPQTYQLMAQSSMAHMHRNMVSNRQIVHEEVTQRMRNSGFEYIGERRFPRMEQWYSGKLREMGGNMQFDLLSTEWQNDQGQKAIVTVSKMWLQQPLAGYDIMTMWFYSTTYLFADQSGYEPAIAASLDALTSTTENPQWIQYRNHLFQQRQRQSAVRHQQHMANRQASFEAHQRKMQGIWAAQDASHAAFMNRNFGPGSNTQQRNYINSIREEETVYNPLTGKNYQVDAGSMQYWMDSDGNYIQNNDLFYTPNGDINLNNRRWERVK